MDTTITTTTTTPIVAGLPVEMVSPPFEIGDIVLAPGADSNKIGYRFVDELFADSDRIIEFLVPASAEMYDRLLGQVADAFQATAEEGAAQLYRFRLVDRAVKGQFGVLATRFVAVALEVAQ